MPPESTPRTAAEIEARYLPLIAAQRLLDEHRRDAEWVPGSRQLAGLEVQPLTLGHVLTLRAAGNAFFAEVPAPADPVELAAFWQAHAAQLLWLLSVDYRPGGIARDAFIARAIRPQPVEGLVSLIGDYIREAFADRPVSVQVEGDQSAPEFGRIAASFAAVWIHELGTAYGWPPSVTLGLTLGQIFQLRQVLRYEAALKAGERPPPCADAGDVLAARCFSEIAALQP